jgi:hypothetical protein
MPDTQLAGFSDCSDGRIEADSCRPEPPQSGGHSGQVPPIEASTSRISATTSSGVTPDG